MIKNSTTCEVDNKVTQRLQVRTGNGSIVSITNVSLDADIESKMICLISASTSITEVAAISSKLKADLQQSNIKFPSLENSKKNVTVKQEYINKVKSAVNFENILKSLQSNMIDQSVVVQAGDNSTVVVDQTRLKAGMLILTDIVNKQVTEILRSVTAQADGDAALKASEVNALQPFTDLIGNIFSGLLAGYLGVMAIFFITIVCVIFALTVALKRGWIKPNTICHTPPFSILPTCRLYNKATHNSADATGPPTGINGLKAHVASELVGRPSPYAPQPP